MEESNLASNNNTCFSMSRIKIYPAQGVNTTTTNNNNNNLNVINNN